MTCYIPPTPLEQAIVVKLFEEAGCFFKEWKLLTRPEETAQYTAHIGMGGGTWTEDGVFVTNIVISPQSYSFGTFLSDRDLIPIRL